MFWSLTDSHSSSFETPRSARLLRMRFSLMVRSAPFARVSNHEVMKSEQLPHRHGGIPHACGETPFIVVPRHHPHQPAVPHLRLSHSALPRIRILLQPD